ncbi:MAG: carbon storage regulator CsrA [Chloroflexi bacterium]|nr:carbon storage regulator CsrA [Chloroflexota bacterium]
MLVLSRRPGQSILVGKDIEVVVLGSDGAQVRIGIRAPRDVTVLRRELLKQIEDENRRAAVTNLGAALGQLGAQALPAPARGVEPEPSAEASARRNGSAA